MITASKPRFRASATAPLARTTGSSSPAGSCTRRPVCRPSTLSCSMAAGRRTSVDTSSACRPCRVSQRPSLPLVVVLPEPCRPSISTTRGRWSVGCSPPAASPNSASISSRTMRRTCWPGVRLRSTSWSSARSRTRSTNALTTLKLTSASSSARRISRSAVSTVASVRRPSPRIVRKTSCNRPLSASNMAVSSAPAAGPGTRRHTPAVSRANPYPNTP